MLRPTHCKPPLWMEMVGPHSLRTAALLMLMLTFWPCAPGLSQDQTRPEPAGPTQGQQFPVKPLSIRLRSFIVGASGTLSFEPTPTGGLVRLTALGMPPLKALLPDAQAYFVWAVPSGGESVRVGQLQIDTNGAGGVEFARPEPLERYSVMVTAELSLAAEAPKGMVVFSTWLGEAKAFFGTRDKTLADQSRALKEMRSRMRLRAKGSDFYAEVDEALNLSLGNGRVIELYGQEAATEAYGVARVTALNSKAYVRALVNKLPPPAAVGANTYILWAIKPGGQIRYMGSLPAVEELNGQDIYVRVAGFITNDYDLFVTAERARPASSPAGPRALSSRGSLAGP